MPKHRKSSGGWSAIQVTIGLAVVVVMLTWMVAASAYASARARALAAIAAEEDGGAVDDVPRIRLRRTSGLVLAVVVVGAFLKNAVVEIPHAPQVAWFVCTERILIPIGFVLMMGVVIALGVGLNVAERSQKSLPRTRRTKVPEIRVPKPQDD